LSLNSGLTFAKQGLYCLKHTSSPFCSVYSGYLGLTNYFPGWPQTEILLISSIWIWLRCVCVSLIYNFPLFIFVYRELTFLVWMYG
jgi:hypothetical protein